MIYREPPGPPDPPWKWYEKFVVAVLAGFVWALMFVLASLVARMILP